MKKALFFILVFVMVQIIAFCAVYSCDFMIKGRDFITSIKMVLLDAAQPTVKLTIITSAVYSLILFVLFLKTKWCEISPSYLKSWPLGVFFWAAMAALGALIPSEVFQELLPLKDTTPKIMEDVMSNRWGYLTICIFAPLVEEVVFRGAVLRALLGTLGNKWTAIVISAALFSIVHLNLSQMPHAFFIGLLLGWMYERTRSIIPGVILHWVNNTVVYVIFNIFPNISDMSYSDLFGGDYRKVALSVVFSLCIFIPSIVQLNYRMRRADQQK